MHILCTYSAQYIHEAIIWRNIYIYIPGFGNNWYAPWFVSMEQHPCVNDDRLLASHVVHGPSSECNACTQQQHMSHRTCSVHSFLMYRVPDKEWSKMLEGRVASIQVSPCRHLLPQCILLSTQCKRKILEKY